MYCMSCGHALPNDAVFCTNCGKRTGFEEIDLPGTSEQGILSSAEVKEAASLPTPDPSADKPQKAAIPQPTPQPNPAEENEGLAENAAFLVGFATGRAKKAAKAAAGTLGKGAFGGENGNRGSHIALITVGAVVALAMLLVLTRSVAPTIEKAFEEPTVRSCADRAIARQLQDVKAPEILVWPSEGLALLLPNPGVSLGTVELDEEDEFKAVLRGYNEDAVETYIGLCKEAGYTNEIPTEGARYAARSESGYSVFVEFDADESEMAVSLMETTHTVTLFVTCVEAGSGLSYGIAVSVDGEELGSLLPGESSPYELELNEFDHVVSFSNLESEGVSAAVAFRVSSPSSCAFEVACEADLLDIDVAPKDGIRAESPVGCVMGEDDARLPFGGGRRNYDHYGDVVAELQSAGFTNVSTKAVYDVHSAGGIFSAKDGEVSSVTVLGGEDFSQGDIFAKDVEIVVSYHSFVWNDPGFSYIKVTAANLFDELESNAARANNKYEGAYVEVTGVVESINDNGKDFCLTSGAWLEYYNILCDLDGIPAERLYELSTGDTVTVRGRMLVVGDMLGYSMTVTDIL